MNLRRLSDPLDKFVALNALHDRNEALFFKVIAENLDEIMPLIYTPTVGLACQRFGQVFQRPRGVFIGINDRGHVAEVLKNWPYPARMIVVTDGERILGLGDLGANGMGIPIGKLALYTGCAGIDPRTCLPVTIDVGTNNAELLADPFYVGLRQRRVTGKAYDELIDEFITAATGDLPGRRHSVRGFCESQRVPPAREIPQAHPDLQRRHPRHCRRRVCRPLFGAARDGGETRSTSRSFSWAPARRRSASRTSW